MTCFSPMRRICVPVVLIGYALLANGAFAQSFNAPGNPCDDAVATSEITACFSKELATADEELNDLYARIKKVLSDPAEAKTLLEAERLWLQYRDATCNAEYQLYGGGSGGPAARLACLAAETRARAASLKRSFGWRLEKFGG